jgi:branched-chain amino acid transport system permease protein
MALFLSAPALLPVWILIVLTLALAKFIAVLGVALFLRGGLVSLGHALFLAVGAYSVGLFVKWFGIREALLAVFVGPACGALIGVIFGPIITRYRGVFFAMINLAFAMILYSALLKFYSFSGGSDGISIGVPTFFGVTPTKDMLELTLYYFVLIAASIAVYATYRFSKSPMGYFLTALSDNEIRIEYSGESVQRIIFITYIFSGALGGLAGVLVAFCVGHIVPEFAFFLQSAELLLVALLGGIGSVFGTLFGSVAFEFIRTYAYKMAPEAWQMTLGMIMLLLILFQPGGLWAMFESLIETIRGGRERAKIG